MRRPLRRWLAERTRRIDRPSRLVSQAWPCGSARSGRLRSARISPIQRSGRPTGRLFGPTHEPTAAGGFRPRQRRSIRACWRCWLPMRTSGLPAITGLRSAGARAGPGTCSSFATVPIVSAFHHTMQCRAACLPRARASFTPKASSDCARIEIERKLSKDQILAFIFRCTVMAAIWKACAPPARLFRQGAAPADAWRSSTAGRLAAVAPEWRRPDRSAEAARRARDRVLDPLPGLWAISMYEIERAKHEPVRKHASRSDAGAAARRRRRGRGYARPRHPSS